MINVGLPKCKTLFGHVDGIAAAFVPGGNTAAGALSEAAVSRLEQKQGAMSNTPCPTSLLGIISEDTAHLSLWVDWGSDEEILFSRFRRAQLESQGKLWGVSEDEESESIANQQVEPQEEEWVDDMARLEGDGYDDDYIEGHGSGYMEFGGQLWYMKPSGKGGGDEKRKSYYRYHLKAGDVNIFIRRDKYETVANIWLEIGSVPLCMAGGIRNAVDAVYKAFKAEGITVMKEILSRVDIYADYDICHVSDFCSRFVNNSRVTRARAISSHAIDEEINHAMYLSGSRYTGVSIGKDIRLRCYDKREEMKKNPIKWGVFAERYGGRIPETLTRVEFQLRRNALKEIQVMKDGETTPGRIEDVDSYLKVRDGLWRYLTCEWFRFTEEPVDKKNNHYSRAKTWSIWEAVQNAVSSLCEAAKRIRRAVQVNPEHNKKMAIGVTMSAAMMECPREIATAGDLVLYFRDIIAEYGRDYFLEVKEKHSQRMFLRVGNSLDGDSQFGVGK